MNNEALSAILLGLISSLALGVIVYWHVATKGTWREWPAGRSLMGLLAIIAVGFGFGVVNRFLGDYAAKFGIAVGLYAGFAAALVFIGVTIRAEMIRGADRARDRAKANHPSTGSIDLPVATDKELTHE